jgi:hypothetical protein
MTEATQWVSYRDAAATIGCSVGLVGRMVRSGELESRGRQERRDLPSVSRVSVFEVAESRAEDRRVAAMRGLERNAWKAPDDGHVWLSSPTAAIVMGMTPLGVRYRAA